MTATDKRPLIFESVMVTRIDIYSTGEEPDNMSCVRLPKSHVQQPSMKSLLSRNWSPAPRMKSWLPVIPSTAIILGCLILPLTNHLKAGGAVRQTSYWVTRFIWPHKTRYVVSTNQSLSSGPKRDDP
jgi:hypothetical protein